MGLWSFKENYPFYVSLIYSVYIIHLHWHLMCPNSKVQVLVNKHFKSKYGICF